MHNQKKYKLNPENLKPCKSGQKPDFDNYDSSYHLAKKYQEDNFACMFKVHSFIN